MPDPYKLLAMAILFQAFRDVADGKRHGRQAMDWLLGREHNPRIRASVLFELLGISLPSNEHEVKEMAQRLRDKRPFSRRNV